MVHVHDGGSGAKLENLLTRAKSGVHGGAVLVGMRVSSDLALVEGLGSLGLEEVDDVDVDGHDDV